MQSHSAQLVIERRVGFAQTDASGLIHFTTYFTLMEAAEAELFRMLGLPLLWQEDGRMKGFPRVDCQCQFRKPAGFDDLIGVELQIAEIAGNRIHYNFAFRDAEGKRLAKGKMVTACAARDEAGNLVSSEIPENYRAAFKAWRAGHPVGQAQQLTEGEAAAARTGEMIAAAPTVTISKDQINALPLKNWEGPVTIVDSDAKLHEVLPEICKEKILGFDTESRPSFKKGQNYPAALVQLGGEHHVWLFQILKIKDKDALWKVLANPRIIKTGVAIADDIKKLQETLDFKPAGFVEIADLTQKSGILNTGLRSLAAILLGMRVSKRAQVSNWARSTLTEAQVQYAATDAWVSRELYLKALAMDGSAVPAVAAAG